MEVIVLEACYREIRTWPGEIYKDYSDAVHRLRQGENLTMPLSRPLPEIRPGVHELRFKGPEGNFRVVYYFRKGDAIYIVHAQ